MTKTDTTEFLQNKYRRLRIYTILMLVLLIAALACVFFSRIGALVLLGVALVYNFSILRRQQKIYSDAVTEANLLNTICPTLHTTELHAADGNAISLKTLQQAALMPIKDSKGSPLFCWGISGTKDGLSISICDTTIAQDFQLKAKGRKRVHFNSGAWIHMELPEDTKKRWCLIDETAVPTPIRMEYFSHRMNMQTASVGNDIVGKRCVLYQPADREHQLSEALLHEIQKLIDYTPGYLAISVKGNSVDFFVRGRFLSRPVSMSKAPTQALVDFNPFPELSYLIKIAKAI